jgi:TniQ
MINFFPVLYEDELLFSAISRYKQMCGMVSKRALMKDLFNKKVVYMSVYFPQHLNILVSNLPPTSKITVSEIIWNHTMFPFFTAFLSKEKTEEIYRLMEVGNGKSVENMIGISGSNIKPNNYLKYCPICLKEDMKLLGESY